MRWPHCARGCSMVAERGTGSSGRCYRCLPLTWSLCALTRATTCSRAQVYGLMPVKAPMLFRPIGVAGARVICVVAPLALHLPLVPLAKFTSGTLKVHAHLSPFSAPLLSLHAPGFAGSLRASLSSWALTFANAASP